MHRLSNNLWSGGAGTIDEKIYQRQLMKGQIADMMEGQGGAKGKKAGAGSRFSVEELKELFKLRLDTQSDTHDLLCKGSAVTGMGHAPACKHSVGLGLSLRNCSDAYQQSILAG